MRLRVEHHCLLSGIHARKSHTAGDRHPEQLRAAPPLSLALSPKGRGERLHWCGPNDQLKESAMSSFAFDPEETTHWDTSHPPTIAPQKWKKFEGYPAPIFSAFGMDLDTPATKTTQTPFVRAL